MHKLTVYVLIIALFAYTISAAPHPKQDDDDNDDNDDDDVETPQYEPSDVITDVNKQINDTLRQILNSRINKREISKEDGDGGKIIISDLYVSYFI